MVGITFPSSVIVCVIPILVPINPLSFILGVGSSDEVSSTAFSSGAVSTAFSSGAVSTAFSSGAVSETLLCFFSFDLSSTDI
ncbi:MAG: hypothetical protein EVA30_00400 [Candidatus Dadabacteria bacterium]|nr:MAG: hypothetical protein EVA30_00400 [Candidatus Dadabacteria bacterium]